MTKNLMLHLIVLDVVQGFLRLGGVPPHDVVVHQGLGSEEREASGRTHDTSDHVLGRLLQPVTDGILKELVPDHGSRSDGVDSTTSRSEVPVLLHQVDQQVDGRGLEVDVSVQGEDVGVLGQHFLAIHGNGQLHKTMSKQVVHVHALRPALLVPDLRLVLQVDEHLGLAWQDVEQPAAVRGRDFLRRTKTDVGLEKFQKLSFQDAPDRKIKKFEN